MKNVMKAVHLTHIGVFGLQELQKIKRLQEYKTMQNKVSEEKAWFNKEPTSPYGISTKPNMNVVGKLHSFLLQHGDGESFMKPFTMGEDVASLCCNRWVSLGLVQAFVKIMNATESSSRALILNGFDRYTSKRINELLQLSPENSKLEHLLLLINVGLESTTGKSFVSDYSRKGNHWAVLDIDITNKKFLYCDSLGWPVPDDLRQMISPIIRSLQELTGRRLPVPCARNPVVIRSAHVPKKVNERGQHECTPECLVNFPLQRCQAICGPIAILTAAICVLFPDLWKILKESHLPINHPILWFAAPSHYAQYLRTFLAEVLVKKKFTKGYFGITSEAVDEVRKIFTDSHVKQMQPNKEPLSSYDSQSRNNSGILKVGGKLKKRFNLKRIYEESEESTSKKVMFGADGRKEELNLSESENHLHYPNCSNDHVYHNNNIEIENVENNDHVGHNRINVKLERDGGDRVNIESERDGGDRINIESERDGGDRINIKSERDGGDRVNIESERDGGDITRATPTIWSHSHLFSSLDCLSADLTTALPTHIYHDAFGTAVDGPGSDFGTMDDIDSGKADRRYEEIVLSYEKLQDYIDEQMPNYYLKKITGDGLCILSSFNEGLRSLGENVTIEFLMDTLRSEILQNFTFYKGFCRENVDLLLELDSFLKHPLQYFNTDSCDTFLMAIGNAMKCNTIILQSSIESCWTVNLSKAENNYSKTIYFARSLSDHFDVVLPRTVAFHSDSSDSDIEIINVVEKQISINLSNVKTEVPEMNEKNPDDEDVVFIGFKPAPLNCGITVKTEKEQELPFEEDSSNLRNSSGEDQDVGVVDCPICHQGFSDNNELKQHIPNCSPKNFAHLPPTKRFQRLPSDQESDSDSTSDNYDDDSSECEDVEIRRNSQGQIVFSRNVWLKCPLQTVDEVPNNIDKLSCYSLHSNSRGELLDKCRDGRPWKHDTRTKWAGYDTVRYKNCNGMPLCPNSECLFKREFGTENRLRFDRSNKCTICGAMGDHIACPARKYTAFKGSCAHVFHHGTHTCAVKQVEQRPVELVASSIAVNPSVKPSAIQGNAILADMRKRKSWNDVQSTVKRVANKKAIANEKTKQKKHFLPKGDNFEAVKEYKKYTDLKDELLVYVVDENNQHLFKTSTVQMNIAKKMLSDSSHPLAKEFCCFD
eukprot:Seg1616.2 transcript_id=Seg1616.2/GoldUCD/mRNA.D3Y31 product="hypothetical protein" protein_id=Seg1616.2/GoldUCD/D3Y31